MVRCRGGRGGCKGVKYGGEVGMGWKFAGGGVFIDGHGMQRSVSGGRSRVWKPGLRSGGFHPLTW